MNEWYRDLIVHLLIVVGILSAFLGSVVFIIHIAEAAVAASLRARRIPSERRGFEVVQAQDRPRAADR